jgi:hypothetical protein
MKMPQQPAAQQRLARQRDSRSSSRSCLVLRPSWANGLRPTQPSGRLGDRDLGYKRQSNGLDGLLGSCRVKT